MNGQKIRAYVRPFVPGPARKVLRKALTAARSVRRHVCAVSAVRRAGRAARQVVRDKQLVVFVSDWPRAREAKLAYALKSKGWRVILLHCHTPNYDMRRYFDEIKQYRDGWHALALASTYAPQAYHAFSRDSDETAKILIEHKPGKVIFDTLDVLPFDPWTHWNRAESALGQALQMKYCIENADGFCARDLQARQLRHNYGCRQPKRALFFPEYCWDFPDSPRQLSIGPSDELHVVVMGTFGIEKQGLTDNGYLDIARLLAAQQVHLHMYVHWYWYFASQKRFEDDYSDYLELADRSPFFHLHLCVPMDTVVTELRKYHVGGSIVRALTYGEELRNYHPLGQRNCGSARVFDYMDAGLPVLVNKQLRHSYSMLSRHGLAIDATPEVLVNARRYLTDCLSSGVADRAARARACYSVRKQIHRLIAFYQDI